MHHEHSDTPEKADKGSRYKKIVAEWEAMDKLLVEFLDSYGGAPAGDGDRCGRDR